MADSTLRKSRTERNRNPLRRFFLAVLVFQIGFSTPILQGRSNTALATELRDEYDAVCGPVLAKNDANAPGYANCINAQNALKAKQQATASAIILTAGAIACGILTSVEWLGAGTACQAISIGLSILKMGFDMFLKQKIEDTTNSAGQAIRTGASSLMGAAATFAGSRLIFGNSPFRSAVASAPAPSAPADSFIGPPTEAEFKATQGNGPRAPDQPAASGADQAAAKKAANKVSCILSSIALGVSAALSAWEATTARTIQAMEQTNAKNAIAAYTSATKIGDGGYSTGSATGGTNDAPRKTVSEAPGSGGSGGCSSKNGNDYLRCLGGNGGTNGPNFSALTADKTLNDLIGSATGGKSLGDLVKSFGDREPTGSNIANHVAGAMGLPSSVGATMGKHMDSLVDAVGKEMSSSGGGYTSKGKSAPASPGSGDPDFSKMMEGLMKQMAPKGEEPVADAAKENPTDAVFRKLDLLPADKIESSNISLFVRVGYRYRKKTPSILTDSEPVSAPAPERFRR